MILPDINLLLYAYNQDSSQYSIANSWWKEMINSQQTIILPNEILFGFIRIATNKRLGEACVSLKQAKKTVDSWLQSPNTVQIFPDHGHYDRVLNLMLRSGLEGSILSDAILASYAIPHVATLCSNDDDFSRFENLIWHNPLK